VVSRYAWAGAVAAAAISVSAAYYYYIATKPGQGGCPSGDVPQNPPGTCPTGYTIDPSAAGCCKPTGTCPAGDFPEPPGGCPPTNPPDPLNPGCCFSCPNSCTGNSDCTPCGNGWICADGQCAQQQLTSIQVNVLNVTLQLTIDYTTGNSACGPFCTECCCCYGTASVNANAPFQLVTLTALDQNGDPMPNVQLAAQYDSEYWQTFSVVNGEPGAQTNTFTTDSNGQVQVAVVALPSHMPYAYQSPSDYSCDACSDTFECPFSCTATNSGTIVGQTSENLAFDAPDWPGIEGLVGVGYVINWNETAYNQEAGDLCSGCQQVCSGPGCTF
jgi:hypothetical protein